MDLTIPQHSVSYLMAVILCDWRESNGQSIAIYCSRGVERTFRG